MTLDVMLTSADQTSSSQQSHLPGDPRSWSKDHVSRWLNVMEERYNISPIDRSRFAMNGRALCLMQREMFIARVPEAGHLLYEDFQLRLRFVLGLAICQWRQNMVIKKKLVDH